MREATWRDTAAHTFQVLLQAAPKPYSQVRQHWQREDAVSVLLPCQKAWKYVLVVREGLSKGLIAFISCDQMLLQENGERAMHCELVIAQGQSSLDALHVAGTQDPRSGKSTDDLRETLQRWDQRYGVDVLRAKENVVVFRLERVPEEFAAFVQELNAFCPAAAVPEERLGAFQRSVRENGTITLWWE